MIKYCIKFLIDRLMFKNKWAVFHKRHITVLDVSGISPIFIKQYIGMIWIFNKTIYSNSQVQFAEKVKSILLVFGPT